MDSPTSVPQLCHRLMVQGTTSDAGKTTLVAGLCRLLYRRGLAVAPFKPQNMALNSAVTRDGGEIGRAQALQAQACGLAPHSDFNPVLLKPSSDCHSQVIVHGKVLSTMDAAAFFGPNSQGYRQQAMGAVLASWQRLCQQYAWLLVEGAGSPAEINLRQGDIANMGFAEAVDCPVILVADIDRGGVFAQLVGTLMLLSASEQARVKGFVINRFRGDLQLLQPGLDWLEQHTGKPVLGVIPYLDKLYLDAEDAISVPQTLLQAQLKVGVLVLPRISNHTDFDPLRQHPGVDLQFITQAGALPALDLLIIPGSKNVRADLAYLRQQGWHEAIARHLRYGGKVLGICGGYQMLGLAIDDPTGIEDTPGDSEGLGWLPVVTELRPFKALHQLQGRVELLGQQVNIQGYEIHCGSTRLLRPVSQPFTLEREDGSMLADGCLSADSQVLGTYLHGLFDQPVACELLLRWAGMAANSCAAVAVDAVREQQLERLADVLERQLDIDKLLQIMKEEYHREPIPRP